jgi:general secretion pathway protein N
MEELCLDPTGVPNTAWGTLQLSETRTSIGRAFALGDFYATFTTADKIIRGEIKDTGGPLDLTGTLTHDPDGRYGFSGELGVRDESNAELRQILGILGQPGTDGKWPLELTGSLGS